MDALDGTLAWLMEHGNHPPYCSRRKANVVPDGRQRFNDPKDYGGRYITDEERQKVPCDCGWDEMIDSLQAATANRPREGGR